MDTPKSKDRIPFESLEDSTPVSGWNLPPMADNSRLVKSAKRENKRTQAASARGDERIESVSAGKKPRALTVEELKEITETAKREGFEQGLKEGTEQGIREGTKVGEKSGQQRAYMESKKDIEALQNQLRTIIGRLYDPAEKQLSALENTLVDIVLNLSKKVIASEIDTKPHLILQLIKKVLADLPKGSQCIQVAMCAEDAERVESLIPENQRDWQIIRDDSLSSGGCRVESNGSAIDFSVEARIDAYFSKISKISKIENANSSETSAVPDYQSELAQIIDDKNEAELRQKAGENKELETTLEASPEKRAALQEASTREETDKNASEQADRD